MLSGSTAVIQASGCVASDPFTFEEDGLTPPQGDVGWGEISDALVASQGVVVGDEVADLLFETAGQVMVLDEQDAVLERLVPVFDLDLGRGMLRRPGNMAHALVMEPFRQTAEHLIAVGHRNIAHLTDAYDTSTGRGRLTVTRKRLFPPEFPNTRS